MDGELKSYAEIRHPMNLYDKGDVIFLSNESPKNVSLLNETEVVAEKSCTWLKIIKDGENNVESQTH